jgi:hypothetical protein|eukprot:Stramenopile-MAST_4_protein_2868
MVNKELMLAETVEGKPLPDLKRSNRPKSRQGLRDLKARVANERASKSISQNKHKDGDGSEACKDIQKEENDEEQTSKNTSSANKKTLNTLKKSLQKKTKSESRAKLGGKQRHNEHQVHIAVVNSKSESKNEIPQFAMRMCLTEEEKQSGLHFDRVKLEQRKKIRGAITKVYKSKVNDMKAEYRVAKRSRRNEIREGLKRLKVEYDEQILESMEPATEIKPWENKRKKLLSQADSKASPSNITHMSINQGLVALDMSKDILDGKEPFGKSDPKGNNKWERLSKTRKASEGPVVHGIKIKKKMPYFVEYMALTREEKLNMIALVTKKEYERNQRVKKLAKLTLHRSQKLDYNSSLQKPTELQPQTNPHIGKLVVDYSTIPRVPDHLKVETKPIELWLPPKPKWSRQLVQNNFPGPKDEVDALAWKMWGQKYFSGNRFEKRYMRLQAEATYVVQARIKNHQWVKQNLRNLDIYKEDIGYNESERAHSVITTVNKRLQTLSFGLKAMYEDDAEQNRVELMNLLESGKLGDEELNKIFDDAIEIISKEFKTLSGSKNIEKRYASMQENLKKKERIINEQFFDERKMLYDNAISYHERAKERRYKINEELKEDEKSIHKRLDELFHSRGEMGQVYDDRRLIPRVKKRRPPPPQRCWVCNAPLTFNKEAEFCFCPECTNFNQNKQSKPLIYPSKDKSKNQAMKALREEVNLVCKEIGRATLSRDIVPLGTFARISRRERQACIDKHAVSPGPGEYGADPNDSVLSDRAGKGRSFSLAKPGTLFRHLEEAKFLDRLKSLGWSKTLQNTAMSERIKMEELQEIADLVEEEKTEDYTA